MLEGLLKMIGEYNVQVVLYMDVVVDVMINVIGDYV